MFKFLTLLTRWQQLAVTRNRPVEPATYTGISFWPVAPAVWVKGAKRGVPLVARVASAEASPVVVSMTLCDQERQAG